MLALFKNRENYVCGRVILVLDEQCCNPLKKCDNKDILIYIQAGVEKLSICQRCWVEISESNLEWNEEGLKTTENNLTTNVT
jgi:hypothetical protein